MNILIDATWIGGMYGSKVMHGGLRVTNEFLKRLGLFSQHNFFLTNTNYLSENIDTLETYARDVIQSKKVKVRARKIGLLDKPGFARMHARVSRYIPIPYLYPFISRDFLNSVDVYHTPVDPIPGLIRHNRKIKKFFTALDLIPLVRPDLSDNFYDYTKILYDSLTPDVNVLAISESTKQDLLKYRKDLSAEKIRVTYLGADEKLFHFISPGNENSVVLEKYQLKNKKYFLTINSMARYKNVEFIIDNFFGFINSESIEDLYLVVIGQNRETRYKEYIESKYGNDRKVIFLDYVEDEDLVHIYNGALAFLYMSLYEGFGLPILEAMQCGTPVICSNSSSMPEVAGSAGILLDPLDNESFRAALRQVYQEPVVLQTLRSEGLKQARKFSWEKYATEVVKAYEEM